MSAAFTPHRRGFLARHPAFPSRHVASRAIEVWLPEQYQIQPEHRCNVLYIHDGLNLWRPAATSGKAWDADLVLADLIDQGAVPPTIIVAIPQHPRLRFEEYMPQAPLATERGQAALARYLRRGWPTADAAQFSADRYLAFLVEELKPFIDATYRTQTEVTHTALMGSSMGGLISLYALTQHPTVFGGAGCLSTHWPALEGITVDWLPGHLPDPATHRIYFDFGTEGLDRHYAPYQAQVDAMMRTAGYHEGENWLTYRAEGADHREDFWAARLAMPLRFLLR